MTEFNWTVDDIERAQRDFSYNFMRLGGIRTESYDVAIDCMTECIEKKAADVQRVKHGKWNHGKCTNCQKSLEDLLEGDFYYDCDELHYCPNCGARMDGDTE